MKLDEIVQKYDVDFTKNLIAVSQIGEIEAALGAKIGVELKEYILKYGYLGYDYIEFYGIYSNMLLKSDMVTQTQYLHKYFAKTLSYIALENLGEGEYAVVDSNDRVYIYISEFDQIKDLNKSVFDYMNSRFEEV